VAQHPRALIGTSGYSYPHWRHGVFYPEGLPHALELEFFASRFPTVELNNPFYRLPRVETFRRWKVRTPKHFRFAVKASRYISHVKRLRHCRDPLRHFVGRARALDPKLAVILIQLPPNMSMNLDRLAAFCKLLSSHRRWALEFRHPSWMTGAVWALLEERGVACCTPVGGILQPTDIIETAPFAYLRMHRGRGREGRFTAAQLRSWADRIRQVLARERDVYVYFNNDWRGFAAMNAAELQELIGASPGSAAAPPDRAVQHGARRD